MFRYGNADAGSHTVHGIARTPVSFKNSSSERTRFGQLISQGMFRGQLLEAMCLQHAVVYNGQLSGTCSTTVWTGSPHGQATCSPVGWGKDHWVYEPINTCPVMTQYSVQSVKRENLAASCLTRNVGRGLSSGSLVSAVFYMRGRPRGWSWGARAARYSLGWASKSSSNAFHTPFLQ
jgi:hypothetical protein